jgi:biotin carboxyl carrier protein
LLVLEAMKMETVVSSPRAGRIELMHVHPGTAVEARDLMLQIAPL